MRKYIIVCTILMIGCHAAGKPPELTTEQALRLQILQKDAIIVKQQLDQLQTQFQQKIAAFNSLCSDYMKADHYPMTATCDIEHATITLPPTSAPATKK